MRTFTGACTRSILILVLVAVGIFIGGSRSAAARLSTACAEDAFVIAYYNGLSPSDPLAYSECDTYIGRTWWEDPPQDAAGNTHGMPGNNYLVVVSGFVHASGNVPYYTPKPQLCETACG